MQILFIILNRVKFRTVLLEKLILAWERIRKCLSVKVKVKV
jgi:hypothetical protein